MKGSSLDSCLHLLSSYQARPRAFPVENETEPPVPFVNGKALGRDCPRTLSWDSQAVRDGVAK